MKGTWIISEDYIIDNRDYYKCGNCGHLQKLDVFNNRMLKCDNCGDIKSIVHRISKPEPKLNKW